MSVLVVATLTMYGSMLRAVFINAGALGVKGIVCAQERDDSLEICSNTTSGSDVSCLVAGSMMMSSLRE